MDPIDYWKFCTDYSVVQAALLIVGCDPNDLQHAVDRDHNRRPAGYTAVRTALVNAIRSGSLEAIVVEETSEFGNRAYIDAHETIINKWDLDRFVKSRGYICTFFASNPAADAVPGPDSLYFSKKLDAANKAWKAVTSDPAKMAGKSPKQALKKWLTEQAGDLGLLNKDGTPNTTGIEEICKVANWKPEGGATATPNATARVTPAGLTHLPTSQRGRQTPHETFSADLDDEIPF